MCGGSVVDQAQTVWVGNNERNWREDEEDDDDC